MERRKDEERKKMIQRQLVQGCVTALKIGSISEFQITDWLTQNGVAIFETEGLTKLIKEAYEKERIC